jgi:hypothetical protein
MLKFRPMSPSLWLGGTAWIFLAAAVFSVLPRPGRVSHSVADPERKVKTPGVEQHVSNVA